MLTREDYRQLAERCALLAGECGAPGVAEIAEALRALALDYLARGLQARSNNRRSDFPDKFATHMRGAAPESADGAESHPQRPGEAGKRNK